MKIVDNVQIYGLRESVKASKYPKAVDIDALTDVITDNTKTLAKCHIGEGHDNFLLGIVVQFDLTCTNKMWVEAERYHFFDIVSSQSTMHRILQFDLAEQCNEYVDPRIIDIVNEKIANHVDGDMESYLGILYNIPSGFRLTARMSTNYRQLKTIYKQRKNHRLKEWVDFCKWIETLPYSELITGEKKHV